MDSLTRVKRAASRRVSADAEYRAALRAAQEDGKSLRAIAAAAGVAHVTVLKMLKD